MKTTDKCYDPTINRPVTLQSKTFLLGDKFYLRNFSDWVENIDLNHEHLVVIEFLRKNYTNYNKHPVVRMVTTELTNRLGADKGSVKYFHNLFPGGIHQAFLIAGLPMMDSCC